MTPHNPPEKNVHLIFDCDDTLINAHDLINQLMQGDNNPNAIISPTLITLCKELIAQQRLGSITINTHQDYSTIEQRMTGMGGLVDAKLLAQSISWNVAASLKNALKKITGNDIDIHLCLQSDIYPPPSSASNPDPAPHQLGHTAALMEACGSDLPMQAASIIDMTGEAKYSGSGIGEGTKATQTAFVLKHIRALQPNGLCHIIYIDDTKENLEKQNLPTRAWLTQQKQADERMLQNILDTDSQNTPLKRTLQNRLAILNEAIAIDDDGIVFEAYHFRHELEHRIEEDPADKTFNLVYSSAAVKVPQTKHIAVDMLIAALIQKPEDPVATPPIDVIERWKKLSETYFNAETGQFPRYLNDRAQTYAWQDFWSSALALVLGYFGYKTEQTIRTEFIDELHQLIANPEIIDIQLVEQKINNGIQQFQPRSANNPEQYKQSLRYCLKGFQTEVTQLTQNDHRPSQNIVP